MKSKEQNEAKNLVNIEQACAAIVAGEATVEDVVAAALAAHITTWDDFGGFYRPSKEALKSLMAAFWSVKNALSAVAPVELPATPEELDRAWEAREKAEADQARLDVHL